MSAYLPINKEKLIQFVSKGIHQANNPEQFRHQMDKEISNVIRNQSNHLRQLRSKMKIKQIEESTTNEREQFRKKLQEKIKIGTQKRIKGIQDRVQSMIHLRKIKESNIAMQQQMKRRQSLDYSLKLIHALEDRYSKMQKINGKSTLQQKLKISSSSSQTLQRINILESRQVKDRSRVKNKKIFDLPESQKINDLYAKRAQNVKKQLQRKEEYNINMIDQKYSKVEQARKRKKEILLERLQRIRSIQQYQEKFKQSKFRQLSQQYEEKKRRAQNNVQIYTLPQSLIHSQISSGKSKFTSLQSNVQEFSSRGSKPNYRQSIRKKIALFMKRQGYN